MSVDFSKKDTSNKAGIFITGGILGFVICIGFMLLFSALLLFFNIDRAYATPFSTISVSGGCYIASYYVAKKLESKGYLYGIIIGAAVFVLITLISLIFGNNFSINTLFHFIIIIISSIIGGIMGVNFKKRIKYI